MVKIQMITQQNHSLVVVGVYHYINMRVVLENGKACFQHANENFQYHQTMSREKTEETKSFAHNLFYGLPGKFFLSLPMSKKYYP
jgi:hypothetical protein